MSLRLNWKWMLAVVLVAVFVFIGYYTYSFIQFANRIHTDPGESRLAPIASTDTPKPVETYVPPKWEGKERVNLLLLGGDSRGAKEAPRSDAILVASVDPVTKQAALFSILRDTYVKIPGRGQDRINAALALGGPELAMKTVSELIGLPIQYYVFTDFQGFIALIDSIGGIDFEVEKDMKYSDSADGHQYDINLKKGLQHLDGKMALQYVRFRHDARSDYTRTERQRNFLKAVAEKLQTSTSLLKLPKILSAIDPYIETNLTVTEMLKLGALGLEIGAQSIESIQLPPNELVEPKNVNGASVIGVNPAKLQQYVKEKLDMAPDEPASGQRVENRGNGGAAGNLSAGAPPMTSSAATYSEVVGAGGSAGNR